MQFFWGSEHLNLILVVGWDGENLIAVDETMDPLFSRAFRVNSHLLVQLKTIFFSSAFPQRSKVIFIPILISRQNLVRVENCDNDAG